MVLYNAAAWGGLTRRGQSVQAKHIPNLITLMRMLLVYPTIALMLSGRYGAALILFAIAGASDGLDGFLAKHYHWQSRLGSFLDPLADKLLLITSFMALAWLNLVPLWLTVVVVLRDLIILAGAIAYYLLHEPFDGQPHWTSKVSTFLQLLLVLMILFDLSIQPMPPIVLPSLIWLVLLSSLGSGFIYIWVWGGRYWHGTRSED
jgi:cardiolipin synthase